MSGNSGSLDFTNMIINRLLANSITAALSESLIVTDAELAKAMNFTAEQQYFNLIFCNHWTLTEI